MSQKKFNMAELVKFCGLAIVLISFNVSIKADVGINIQQQSAKAPEQISHFGRLVGDWNIRDYSKDKQGKWQEGPGANWNFYWILGGNAIQDDWISPALSKPAPEKGRQFGTNIRTYNAKQNKWYTAWTANTSNKIDTFSASSNANEMVMQGLYGGAETRITFFNITSKRFSWKMEREDSTKKKWQAIYKIEGYRVE